MRTAVAANPGARRDTIDLLLADVAERVGDPQRAAVAAAVLGNPSSAVWLFLDLTWLEKQPAAVAHALATSPALTPVLWGALALHPAGRVKLALLRSPAAPVEAAGALGLRSAAALSLGGEHLRDEDVIALVGSAGALAATELDLSRNFDLSDDAFVAVAQSTSLPELRRLALDSTFLGPRGARALASSTTLGRLESLELYETEIEDEGALALAQSAAFPGLRRLDLSSDIEYTHHAVGDAGVVALAQSTTLGQLRYLDLSGSSISDVGVQSLAYSRAFPHLEELRLVGTALGETGLLALARSPLLASLRRLDVRYCREVAARDVLLEATVRHPGLTLVM